MVYARGDAKELLAEAMGRSSVEDARFRCAVFDGFQHVRESADMDIVAVQIKIQCVR
jgi:hypothetical protein